MPHWRFSIRNSSLDLNGPAFIPDRQKCFTFQEASYTQRGILFPRWLQAGSTDLGWPLISQYNLSPQRAFDVCYGRYCHGRHCSHLTTAFPMLGQSHVFPTCFLDTNSREVTFPDSLHTEVMNSTPHHVEEWDLRSCRKSEDLNPYHLSPSDRLWSDHSKSTYYDVLCFPAFYAKSIQAQDVS